MHTFSTGGTIFYPVNCLCVHSDTQSKILNGNSGVYTCIIKGFKNIPWFIIGIALSAFSTKSPLNRIFFSPKVISKQNTEVSKYEKQKKNIFPVKSSI